MFFQTPIPNPTVFGLDDILIIFTTVVGALGTFWAIVLFLAKPKLREMIQDTIITSIGKQIEDVPRLVLALEKLTTAIEHQGIDTANLALSIKETNRKVEEISQEISDLSVRTAIVETVCHNRHPTGK